MRERETVPQMQPLNMHLKLVAPRRQYIREDPVHLDAFLVIDIIRHQDASLPDAVDPFPIFLLVSVIGGGALPADAPSSSQAIQFFSKTG